MSEDKKPDFPLRSMASEYQLTLKDIGLVEDDVDRKSVAHSNRGAEYEHCAKCNNEFRNTENGVVIRCSWCDVYIYATGAMRLYSEKAMRRVSRRDVDDSMIKQENPDTEEGCFSLKEIARCKSILIERIKTALEPHLQDTGFVEEDRVAVRTVIFGETGWANYIEMDVGLSNDIALGFTANGVITDIYMGLIVTRFDALFLEELIGVDDFLKGYLEGRTNE